MTAGAPTGQGIAPHDLGDLMVVFDWNGTLMADLDRAVLATNDVLAGYGLAPLSTDAFRTGFTLPLAGWLVRLGVSGPDAGAAEHAWNRAMAARTARPRRGAVTTLAGLAGRGAHVGIVSAAGTDAVHADLRTSGLEPYVHSVATGIVDKAAHLREHRSLRRRAIYVGDTEYDMESAHRAGYDAVAVTGGYRPAAALRDARPIAVVDDLTDLMRIVATA